MMIPINSDEPPLGQYSLQERNTILNREVKRFVENGYKVLWQSDCDAQVFKQRAYFRSSDEIIGFLVGYSFYDIFMKKDSLMLIEINEYGKVSKTEMGYGQNPKSTPISGKKHSEGLSALLVLAFILNSIGAIFSYFFGLDSETPQIKVIYLFMTVISLLCMLFTVAIWKWEKWGVYGYSSFQLINVVLGQRYGNWFFSLLLLISIIFLLFLVKQPVWKDFE